MELVAKQQTGGLNQACQAYIDLWDLSSSGLTILLKQ